MLHCLAGVGLLLLGLAAADSAPDPNVTDAEFATLVADIDAAQDKLLGLISGMTDEQWTFKAGPNRWSVAECVEHISRTERAILGGIQYAVMRPPNAAWNEQTQGKLELVRKVVLDRPKNGVGSPFQVSSGSEVAPTEGWSRERAFREFYASHGELRTYVEVMPREIKNRTFDNPFPSIGTINAHQWLTLAALHVMRHSEQIAEVQADPGYPKRASGN